MLPAVKRFLLAALVAGAVFALLGPVFVHFVLTDDMEQELVAVLERVAGHEPGQGGGALQGLLHVALRLLMGLLTVAVFVPLQRKRGRLRAARLAGFVVWLLAYVVWPIYLAAAHGMTLLLLFVAMGYGLIETQLAAHAGAIAWGRGNRGAPPGKPAK